MTPEACKKFNLRTQRVSQGNYAGILSVRQSLNYEEDKRFTMVIQAQDSSNDPTASLSSTSTVTIEIVDVQDQPPVFLNAPYTMVLKENSAAGTSVGFILARDGDTGDPRPLKLDIVGDVANYFRIDSFEMDGAVASATLATTKNLIDRESDAIMHNGGIYTFALKVLADSSIQSDELNELNEMNDPDRLLRSWKV